MRYKIVWVICMWIFILGQPCLRADETVIIAKGREILLT